MSDIDVAIVGAGPTGLALAGELALAGVSCAVFERRAEELIKAVRRRRAGEPDRVRRHLLPTELVVRGTTGPA